MWTADLNCCMNCSRRAGCPDFIEFRALSRIVATLNEEKEAGAPKGGLGVIIVACKDMG
jgi:hypothetical protein